MASEQRLGRIESGRNSKCPGSADTLRGRHQEVSPDAASTLQTLALAARIQRDAMKDKSYRRLLSASKLLVTTVGRRTNGEPPPDTLRDYEAILAKLALDRADLELADFEPPVGTERLREFIDNRCGTSSANIYAHLNTSDLETALKALNEGQT